MWSLIVMTDPGQNGCHCWSGAWAWNKVFTAQRPEPGLHDLPASLLVWELYELTNRILGSLPSSWSFAGNKNMTNKRICPFKPRKAISASPHSKRCRTWKRRYTSNPQFVVTLTFIAVSSMRYIPNIYPGLRLTQKGHKNGDCFMISIAWD